MQGLSGSFGIVLSVPFTVLFASILYLKKHKQAENTEAAETARAQIHNVTEASENI